MRGLPLLSRVSAELWWRRCSVLSVARRMSEAEGVQWRVLPAARYRFLSLLLLSRSLSLSLPTHLSSPLALHLRAPGLHAAGQLTTLSPPPERLRDIPLRLCKAAVSPSLSLSLCQPVSPPPLRYLPPCRTLCVTPWFVSSPFFLLFFFGSPQRNVPSRAAGGCTFVVGSVCVSSPLVLFFVCAVCAFVFSRSPPCLTRAW